MITDNSKHLSGMGLEDFMKSQVELTSTGLDEANCGIEPCPAFADLLDVEEAPPIKTKKGATGSPPKKRN